MYLSESHKEIFPAGLKLLKAQACLGLVATTNFKQLNNIEGTKFPLRSRHSTMEEAELCGNEVC